MVLAAASASMINTVNGPGFRGRRLSWMCACYPIIKFKFHLQSPVLSKISPSLKGLETAPFSRIHSLSKTCSCLIHLPVLPMHTNSIIAAVMNVEKAANWDSISNPATLAAPSSPTTTPRHTACESARAHKRICSVGPPQHLGFLFGLIRLVVALCQRAAGTLGAQRWPTGIALLSVVGYAKQQLKVMWF